MAGTKTGGAKAATTNKQRHGEDFYKKIGSQGGTKTFESGKLIQYGFRNDNRSLLDKLMGKPSRAQLAGAKGGRISRRGKVSVV